MHPKAFMSEEEANWPELVAKEENAGRPEVCSLAVGGGQSPGGCSMTDLLGGMNTVVL